MDTVLPDVLLNSFVCFEILFTTDQFSAYAVEYVVISTSSTVSTVTSGSSSIEKYSVSPSASSANTGIGAVINAQAAAIAITLIRIFPIPAPPLLFYKFSEFSALTF